jgi:hypothetical protein
VGRSDMPQLGTFFQHIVLHLCHQLWLEVQVGEAVQDARDQWLPFSKHLLEMEGDGGVLLVGRG